MSVNKNAKKPREEVALITGSRRGIGLGIARQLAREGFQIVLNSTSSVDSAGQALEAVNALREECLYIQGDISRREDREQLVSKIKEKCGRLDILVNNAGVGPKVREDILVASEESFDRLIKIKPISRWGVPDDIGRAVAAIARDYFPFSTGEVFNVDGGFHLRIL
jgi:NAD(P)-dependent dehydrogenase (short-subunit alcohol dehydrogenase family)